MAGRGVQMRHDFRCVGRCAGEVRECSRLEKEFHAALAGRAVASTASIDGSEEAMRSCRRVAELAGVAVGVHFEGLKHGAEESKRSEV